MTKSTQGGNPSTSGKNRFNLLDLWVTCWRYAEKKKVIITYDGNEYAIQMFTTRLELVQTAERNKIRCVSYFSCNKLYSQCC